jgi:hypothetical protein
MLTMIHAGVLPAPAQQVVAELAGTYSGNVVVREPVALGALTLVLGVTNNGGVLNGAVDPSQTLVFLGGPSFTGNVIAGEGITPTFRIDSESFTREVSGRNTVRKFTLMGEVLDNGNVLKGNYLETINGFTPQPMLVTGTFHLVRPAGSQLVITPGVGATPTPMPPGPVVTPPGPVVTPTGPDDEGTTILLPVIKAGEPAGTAQENTTAEIP